MADKAQEPISQALARLLQEQGMKPAELCRRARVSPGAVSRYLSGCRGTRLDRRGARTIERIAPVLEIRPDYFREYRAWCVREIAVACPDLLDDFYDLIVETARLRGMIK